MDPRQGINILREVYRGMGAIPDPDSRNRFDHDERREKRWEHLTDGFKYVPKPGTDAGVIADQTQIAKHKRIVAEMMLDNMARRMIAEETLLSDIPTFTTFAFPLVRDVFFKLIANDLVSLQPMTGPTGRIFYRHTTYGTTRSAVTAGDRVDLVFDKAYGANVTPGGAVPELNTQIVPVTVTALSQKLRAKWPVEVEQDLQSQYGLDMTSEMMNDMTGQIARMTDRDIVEDLLANAGAGNVNWNINGGSVSPYSTLDPKVYKNTLYDAIVDANDLVFKKRYVNPNWIVAGADTCSRLEKLENFKLLEGADAGLRSIGIIRFGTLAQRWTVYKDPLFDTSKILLGFKGPSWLDTGYVHAPYIAMWVTPIFTDPATFEISRGMMSRYAKQIVVPNYYSTVTLTSS